MIRHLVNIVLSVLPPSRLFGLRRQLLRLAGLELGRNVRICGRGWFYGRGRFRVGDETWLSPGVIAYTNTEADIVIGAHCDVGNDVVFVPGSHAVGPGGRRAGPGTARPIAVGDGCWIGARCTILGGVRIGRGSIVAAGSVVTRDLPEDTLAAGVPACSKRRLP